MSAAAFMSELKNLRFKNTFNPYFDCCEVYDYKNAPQKRRSILKKLLVTAERVDVDAIWVGRDLGYRGGRRTGLALTDDVNFEKHLKRWSVKSEKFTKGEVVPERTASIIWKMLESIDENIFLWNVFPLHPYESNSPFSNRAHNSFEREAGEQLLKMLVKNIRPKRIVAIGNDADRAVKKFSSIMEIKKVRHPSYGGQSTFIKQIAEIYGL